MSEELKPCSCGGLVYVGSYKFIDATLSGIGCMHCGRTTGMTEEKSEAIAAWNRRAFMTATPAAEEGESCPLCGALPIDQVDSHAVEQHVRNRHKLSRQGLLDGCAAREAAQRIVAWDDNGRLADDEWLVERNETAIIAICRALLSSPRVEDVRRMREALEKIRDHWATNYDHPNANAEMYRGPYGIGVVDGHRECARLADEAIRSLSPQGG